MKNKQRKPIHPGVIYYNEVLKPLHITITEAAKQLNISRKTLSEIINEKVPLTLDIARRFAGSTNTSIEVWYNMQVKLDLWKINSKLYKDIKPFAVRKQNR